MTAYREPGHVCPEPKKLAAPKLPRAYWCSVAHFFVAIGVIVLAFAASHHRLAAGENASTVLVFVTVFTVLAVIGNGIYLASLFEDEDRAARKSEEAQ